MKAPAPQGSPQDAPQASAQAVSQAVAPGPAAAPVINQQEQPSPSDVVSAQDETSPEFDSLVQGVSTVHTFAQLSALALSTNAAENPLFPRVLASSIPPTDIFAQYNPSGAAPPPLDPPTALLPPPNAIAAQGGQPDDTVHPPEALFPDNRGGERSPCSSTVQRQQRTTFPASIDANRESNDELSDMSENELGEGECMYAQRGNMYTYASERAPAGARFYYREPPIRDLEEDECRGLETEWKAISAFLYGSNVIYFRKEDLLLPQIFQQLFEPNKDSYMSEYSCTKCEYEFPNYVSFMYHSQCVRGEDKTIIDCHKCEKVPMLDRNLVSGPIGFFIHPLITKSMLNLVNRTDAPWGSPPSDDPDGAPLRFPLFDRYAIPTAPALIYGNLNCRRFWGSKVKLFVDRHDIDFATLMKGMNTIWTQPKPLENIAWTTRSFFLQLFKNYKEWPKSARKNALVPPKENGNPGIMSDSDSDNNDDDDDDDDGMGGGGGGGGETQPKRRKRRKKKRRKKN